MDLSRAWPVMATMAGHLWPLADMAADNDNDAYMHAYIHAYMNTYIDACMHACIH